MKNEDFTKLFVLVVLIGLLMSLLPINFFNWWWDESLGWEHSKFDLALVYAAGAINVLLPLLIVSLTRSHRLDFSEDKPRRRSYRKRRPRDFG